VQAVAADGNMLSAVDAAVQVGSDGESGIARPSWSLPSVFITLFTRLRHLVEYILIHVYLLILSFSFNQCFYVNNKPTRVLHVDLAHGSITSFTITFQN